MSGGLFLLFRLPQNFYLVKTKGGFKIEKASFLVNKSVNICYQILKICYQTFLIFQDF